MFINGHDKLIVVNVLKVLAVVTVESRSNKDRNKTKIYAVVVIYVIVVSEKVEIVIYGFTNLNYNIFN